MSINGRALMYTRVDSCRKQRAGCGEQDGTVVVSRKVGCNKQKGTTAHINTPRFHVKCIPNIFICQDNGCKTHREATLELPLTRSIFLFSLLSSQDTILLLLGCKWTEACPSLGEGSSPPLSDTPPCTCWLLAFEANGSTDSDSKCRLLQSYSPSTVDPHHTG